MGAPQRRYVDGPHGRVVAGPADVDVKDAPEVVFGAHTEPAAVGKRSYTDGEHGRVIAGPADHMAKASPSTTKAGGGTAKAGGDTDGYAIDSRKARKR